MFISVVSHCQLKTVCWAMSLIDSNHKILCMCVCVCVCVSLTGVVGQGNINRFAGGGKRGIKEAVCILTCVLLEFASSVCGVIVMRIRKRVRLLCVLGVFGVIVMCVMR